MFCFSGSTVWEKIIVLKSDETIHDNMQLSRTTHLRTLQTTYIGLRRSSTAATLFHRHIVCRSTHTQHIRDRSFAVAGQRV